jgi:hypothetical protein
MSAVAIFLFAKHPSEWGRATLQKFFVEGHYFILQCHNVILIPQSREKNLGSIFDRASQRK